MSQNEIDFTFVIPNTRWHRGGEGRYWNHIPYPEGILTAVLRKNGFKVSKDSFIVFCNADISLEDWKESLNFDVYVINYKMNYSWVEPTLDKIKKLLLDKKVPDFNDPDNCDMCRFIVDQKEAGAL